MIMKAIISRYYGSTSTKGTLQIFEGDDLLYSCKTIELRFLNNIKNKSCIPEGDYDVIKYDSPSKGQCFRLLNVPNRSDILIHKGNFVAGDKIDSLGCILPGLRFADINQDGLIDVADSTKAMEQLLFLLPNSFKLYIL